jgi:hypothetical protein
MALELVRHGQVKMLAILVHPETMLDDAPPDQSLCGT